jgi:protein archease
MPSSIFFGTLSFSPNPHAEAIIRCKTGIGQAWDIISIMVLQSSGFKENAHTADWELNVWAPDFPGLLEQAARGMYWLAKVQILAGPRVNRSLQFPMDDGEVVLVRFLEELLYLSEVDGLAFDVFNIRSSQGLLSAELSGAPIAQQSKEIKAVTYHNLSIQQTDQGLSACIVFDV